MLVGGIIVEHRVDWLLQPGPCVRQRQEADELHVAVALHAAADDGSVEQAERGEQGGGAVALIVMGHGLTAPGLIGNPGWVRSRAWI